jgi:hypothetical protein
VALAVASYLVRIVWPLGTYILSFPTLAYLPQHLSFFLVGIVASRRDWLRTIPSSVGKWGFVAAPVATVILLPLAFRGQAAFLGGGSWYSGVYALWDSTLSVGMVLGLTTLFRRHFDRPGWLGTLLSRKAFTVYVIHVPIIGFLAAFGLRAIHVEQLLKFGLAAIIGVPLCFAAAYLVRTIPYSVTHLVRPPHRLSHFGGPPPQPL